MGLQCRGMRLRWTGVLDWTMGYERSCECDLREEKPADSVYVSDIEAWRYLVLSKS